MPMVHTKCRGKIEGRVLAVMEYPHHSNGSARYLATGEHPVLDNRMEINGIRFDETEVPLKVSIVRLPGAGPTMFAGSLDGRLAVN